MQICIDEERLARVTDIAHARGTSIAAVIRDAIDLAFGSHGPDIQPAIQRLVADRIIAIAGQRAPTT